MDVASSHASAHPFRVGGGFVAEVRFPRMNDDDLKRLIESSAAETRRHTESVAAETRKHVDSVAVETRQHVDSVAAETRRHFDTSTEAFRHEVQLLAESVDVRLQQVDERFARLEDKMDRGFADTQGMIKFSHAELDRRVRTLEQALAELQARVERLETTTH